MSSSSIKVIIKYFNKPVNHHNTTVKRKKNLFWKLISALLTFFMSYISFPDTVLEAAMHVQITSELPLTTPKPTKPNPVKQSKRSDQTNPIPTRLEPQSITNHPTSIEFVTEQRSLSRVKSVCHYKQYTYVGRYGYGGVERISDGGQVQKSFIDVGDQYCESITVRDDRLYILIGYWDQCYKVHIYDLSGKLMGSWTTSIGYRTFNKHCIVDNKLIIPDPSNKQLVVFSLTGDIIRRIPCDLCTDGEVATNVGGDNSVIVSVQGGNKVFRINIDSGEVMWVSNRVTRPQGVVCFKNRYVLVTNYGSETRIWILDINTGESDIFCHLDFRLFWKIMSLKKYTSTAGVSFKFSQNSSRN